MSNIEINEELLNLLNDIYVKQKENKKNICLLYPVLKILIDDHGKILADKDHVKSDDFMKLTQDDDKVKSGQIYLKRDALVRRVAELLDLEPDDITTPQNAKHTMHYFSRLAGNDNSLQKIFSRMKIYEDNYTRFLRIVDENLEQVQAGVAAFEKERGGKDRTKVFVADFYNNVITKKLNDDEYENSNKETQETLPEKPNNTFPLNQILYGPPGTGKTYNTVIEALKIIESLDIPKGVYKERKVRFDELKRQGQIKFVTFHQSFSYEDFIEGIGAETSNGQLTYTIKSGVFKLLCEAAREDKNKKFVLIIDEINRGNISRIFGELISLIEDTKREGMDEALSVTLPYSKVEFSVPKNLYIIGTMNTADRSLALMDTALRRRFSFIEKMPEPESLKDIEVKGVNIGEMLTAINERIEAIYDREHTIGHAFFMGLKKNPELKDLSNIFEQKILPLLEEYFFEDWEKVNLVLNNNGMYEIKATDSKYIKKIESIKTTFFRTEIDKWKEYNFKKIYGE